MPTRPPATTLPPATRPIHVVSCSLCAYQASGVVPLSVAHAASAHDRYVHGIGVTLADYLTRKAHAR